MTSNITNLCRSGVFASLLIAAFLLGRNMGNSNQAASSFNTEKAQASKAPNFQSWSRTSPSSSPAAPTVPSATDEISDPTELTRQFAAVKGLREKSEYITLTLARLAVEDPEATLPFAASLPPGPWRTPAIMQALETLATAGCSAEALRQAPDLLSAADLPPTQVAIAAGWARRAPQEAMEWTRTLTDPILRSTAVEAIAAQWGESDPAAALTWLGSQAEMPEWKDVMTTVTASWAASDPEAALGWAKTQAEQVSDGPNPVPTVFQQWGESDPESAAAALLLASPAIQQQAVVSIVRNLAWLDRTTANTWVNRLTDSTVRQTAQTALDEFQTPLHAGTP